MTCIVREWKRLSHRFADINGRGCEAAEEAKASMLLEAQRGIPFSLLTVAKLDEAVALLAEARQLMSLLIGVHTKLFPDDQKIFEVKSMVESSVEKLEADRDELRRTLDEI